MKGLLCFVLLLSTPGFCQDTPDSISQEILVLSNQVRLQAGMQPLTMDEHLVQAALQHSREMDSLNYFGHSSPVELYSTLTKRLYAAGCYVLTSAENLHRDQGYGPAKAAKRAVAAWMASPIHRKNLLNPRYNRVGMGVTVQGSQCTITQNFAYSAIEVLEKKVDEKPRGYHLSLRCQVQDGPQNGAILLEGRRCANWTANAQGQFQVEVDLPGPGLVSLGQAEGERSWVIETEFKVPQEVRDQVVN